jgi:GPH family glycoside/pentoside/hexuronide:cation symporter
VTSLSSRTTGALAAAVAGFSLAEQLVVVLVLYFYLPPGGRGLVAQVPEAPLWGPVTVFGAAMLLGRAVDSFADPIVGHLSDRSRSRLGRRRVFLAGAFVPLGLLPALAFFPPGATGSLENGWFLAAVLAGFFAAFATYVVPLLALLPELAREPAERNRLATWIGISSLGVGLGFPMLAFPAAGALQSGFGMEATTAVRAVAGAGALLALGLCAAPIAALPAGHLPQTAPALSLREALGTSLRDRPFLVYVAGQFFIVLAVGLVAPLLPYFAVSVLRRSESFVAVLVLPVALGIAVGFALLPRVLSAWGPRRALLGATLVTAPSLALWALVGATHPVLALACLFPLGAGIATFGVAPYLLIAQVIDADAARGGVSRGALYFGVQGFALKWVRGLGGAVLAWLFAIGGNSPERPGGILAAEALASVCLLIAAGFIAAYPEARVLRAAASAPTSRPGA